CKKADQCGQPFFVWGSCSGGTTCRAGRGPRGNAFYGKERAWMALRSPRWHACAAPEAGTYGVRPLPALLQVGVDQLGQFEHGDLIFAEDRTQLGVGIDVALVAGVLQVVLFDVFPDLFGDLG